MKTNTVEDTVNIKANKEICIIHPHLKFTEDENGLQYIEIDNQFATAKIALQGAHLMHWQPKTEKHPVLWLSDNARFVKGRSIRGGIPICWPWFGAHPTDSSLCPHGFARVIPWQLIDADSTYSGATRLALQMIQTPEAERQLSYPYMLTMLITIGRRLKIDLATTNKANHPFVIGEAFHTYLNVSDIEKIRITGLQECIYADKIKNYERAVENGYLKFNGEFDRVFINHTADCVVHDSGYNRLIRVAKSGSNTTVVWTPWEEKAHAMGDMGTGDEWRKTICVESTNALENMVVINPNRTHVMTVEYNVEAL